MLPNLIFGVTKTLVTNRKLQLALIGLQFGYVTYKMIEEKRAKSKKDKQQSVS
ncbi:hypothetical protein M0G43_12575 [Subsaxibacter sp. CAU 1640]|uniref:hypothetical protein n=1 Tax=Subsaxibacter sp. CAU 1640 TaxID=2933271 RepID=UPI0020069DE4|nr:hypothetical protein [Subsaxibacter sp. CAU 1640]MCK7591413.1 hypothetical protein [Subsaxibacter sp. CAU 1640]